MLLHPRFIRRQLSGAGSQTGVFVLCVALSMLALASLRGFGSRVSAALVQDARGLHAADVIVSAHRDFSPGLLAAVDDAARRGEALSTRTWEFYSMAAPGAREGSLLVLVKAAGPGYPWYGEVALASGRAFADVLQPGSAIVDAGVLGRLGLAIGETLVLGGAPLRIADVVSRESDRPVSVFSLGPRVFVAASDLDRLGLVGSGSRVEYRLLLKATDPAAVDRVASRLAAAALPDAERVRTALTAGSGAQRFFDNFLFFLTLIGFFTLLLAGIGVQSALSALLREKRRTVAVLKAVGAPGAFIARQYLAVVAVLGAAGTAIGAAASLALQTLLLPLFAGLLPAGVRAGISAGALLEGVAVGVVATAVFAYLPLRGLVEVAPVAIFRRAPARLPPRGCPRAAPPGSSRWRPRCSSAGSFWRRRATRGPRSGCSGASAR